MVPPLAVMVALYTAPTVPLGRVFVIFSVAGAMTMVCDDVAFCAGLPVSVTFTVTVELPAVVGVPLTVHPVSVSPAGRVPEEMEQLYGGVPSLAVMVELYTVPTVPPGKVLVMVSAAGAMTMVSFWLAFCAGLPESVTCTVIGELPAAVGVPLTVHPVSVSPAGSVPEVMEQAYGDVPPVAVMVPE